MRRLNLEECLKKYDEEKGSRSRASLAGKGHIYWKCMDTESHTIKEEGHITNLLTHNFLDAWVTYGTIYNTSMFIGISEDTDPMFVNKIFVRSSMVKTPSSTVLSATFAGDPANFTMGWSAIFSPPSATKVRNISTIYLTRSAGSAFSTNATFIQNILAGTALTTPIVQDDTTSVEILYRVTFLGA